MKKNLLHFNNLEKEIKKNLFLETDCFHCKCWV